MAEQEQIQTKILSALSTVEKLSLVMLLMTLYICKTDKLLLERINYLASTVVFKV